MDQARKVTAARMAGAAETPRRSGGVHDISALAARLSAPALRRHGFAQHDILARWLDIAGPVLGAESLPVKLGFPPSGKLAAKRGGTLTIQITGAFAVQMQHVQDLIVERINSQLGYRAVERLRLVQSDLPQRARLARLPVPAQVIAVPDCVQAMPEGPLKTALVQLAATFPVDIPTAEPNSQ